MQKNKMAGILYVVATPIGNLQDMTLRAIEILKNVDRIAAEDTRHSKPLLKHFSINKPIISLHEFNERDRVEMVLGCIQQGESVALISDAGTPLINDPGFQLVKHAKEAGLVVIPIPGACAAIAALSAAGLPSDKFVFEGFLPSKQEARRNRLKSLLHETRTIIFYEAPHRLLAGLQDMLAIFGAEKKAVVARELTKIHESIIMTELPQLIVHFETHPDQQRGEIVILLEGTPLKAGASKEVFPEVVLEVLMAELPLKQAVTLASKITNERKNILYEKALSKK